MRGLNLFPEKYLDFRQNVKLPEVTIKKENGQYDIQTGKDWSKSIYWEIYLLAIISELYNRTLVEQSGLKESDVENRGVRRFLDKAAKLKKYPGIKFVDYGTRRRFFRRLHRKIIEVAKNEIPGQIIGTSNLLLAKELGMDAFGSMAHELFMAFLGIYWGNGTDEELRGSHNKVLEQWRQIFDGKLSTALTDTYGSDFFFRDFTRLQAELWRNLRQDSGNPFAFGERAILFYKNLDIDPKDKTLVFSDGLDVDTIIKLYLHFHDRINVLFGWGTNLTNDFGFDALSLVIKLIEANGHGTVKLSDNLAKAIGLLMNIERMKRVVDYKEIFSQECVY